MKIKTMKYLVASVTCILGSLALWAANDPDLSKGLDLSGRSTVTPYMLNQLVDAGQLRTNRSAVLLTNAAPDVITNPRYTNWLWLDQSSLPFVLKTWNANSNAWIAVSFGSNAITTAQIGDSQVTTPKIANGAVTTDKLGDGSVSEAKIIAGQISASKMANNAITTAAITNGAVTSDKIAINGVITTNITDGSVTSNKLAAGSVTADKFAAGAIGAVSISDNSIDGIKVVTGGIRTTNIASGAITTNKISFGMWLSTNQTAAIPAAGSAAAFTHTFPAQPQSIRVVLICTSADLNYSVGDEVEISGFHNVVGADDYPAFSVITTTSGTSVIRGSGASTITGMNKTTGAAAGITTGNWNVKYYATYFPTPN